MSHHHRNYVEMVVLQKLQIQSASLVAIGANPLNLFPLRLPVLATHTVLPGPVNLWVLFPFYQSLFPGKRFPTVYGPPP